MENFNKIVVLENEIQAQLLDSVLTEQLIPHVMRSYHDFALDGLFHDQKGWGHVEASSEFKDKILSILEDLDQGASIPEDDSE